jgi:hypothetical protein
MSTNQSNLDFPRITRILVVTDFSDQASKALNWAQSFAAAFGAKLVALHVIDIFSLAETSCVTTGLDPLPLLREQAQRCMDGLKQLMPDAENPGSRRFATSSHCRCRARTELPNDYHGHPRPLRIGAFTAGQRCRVCRQKQQSTRAYRPHALTLQTAVNHPSYPHHLIAHSIHEPGAISRATSRITPTSHHSAISGIVLRCHGVT